jgi:hypothetical protein
VKVCARAFPPRPIHLVRLSLHQIVFIAEITARAFIVADSNKRRTLSRADIAKALGKADQFDFLIDIVPRDEPFVPGVSGPGKNAVKKTIPGSTSVKRDPVSGTNFFFFHVPSVNRCAIRINRRCQKMHKVRHRVNPSL